MDHIKLLYKTFNWLKMINDEISHFDWLSHFIAIRNHKIYNCCFYEFFIHDCWDRLVRLIGQVHARPELLNTGTLCTRLVHSSLCNCQ